MNYKTFDFKNKTTELFENNQVNVWVSNVSDTLFTVAQINAGKKFDVVFTESDYLKFGKLITGALKRACAEFSILLIEDSNFDHAKNKSFFRFNGEIVVVVGNYDLISVTSYYASISNKETYAVLTEPNLEYLFLEKSRIPANGMHVFVGVNPLKGVIVDVDVLSKASSIAYQESYISVMSKLVTLIDYKFSVLITGEEFNLKSYQNVKSVISLVAGLNAYENRKEVLIYAQLALAVERKLSNVLTDSAVESYSDALGMFSSSSKKGENLLTAMRIIIEVYETLFVNDLTNLLKVADYNKDIEFLEKTTGKSGSYFRKNINIPSPKRLDLINKIIKKTKSGFLKEIESVLFVLKAIEKVYYSFSKKEEDKIPYNAKKQALLVSTYLSNKITLLAHMRDMGVLGCVDEK